MPLQVIGQNSYDKSILDSHELAKDLRELYDLPAIKAEEQLSTDIITNLSGFLKEYASVNESSFDLVKLDRENTGIFP
jgi:hypothetical protein